MAVFRVEKNKDYTVMSNYHLKDRNISLKSKGLLSQMLSLPEDWNYTLEGLAQINKEKIDAIRAAVKELEGYGYIRRSRERDSKGRLGDTVYVIFERPHQPTLENPTLENPMLDNPTLDYPMQEKPTLENPMQLNTNIQNTNISNTKSINHSYQEQEGMSIERVDIYRDIVRDNIDYEILVSVLPEHEMLDEIVELIVETICGQRKSIRISGAAYQIEVVRSKFLKLNRDHIEYVMDGMKNNKTHVRNIKAYLLAALFNAPTTINNAYIAKVNHDESI